MSAGEFLRDPAVGAWAMGLQRAAALVIVVLAAGCATKRPAPVVERAPEPPPPRVEAPRPAPPLGAVIDQTPVGRAGRRWRVAGVVTGPVVRW